MTSKKRSVEIPSTEILPSSGTGFLRTAAKLKSVDHVDPFWSQGSDDLYTTAGPLTDAENAHIDALIKHMDAEKSQQIPKSNKKRFAEIILRRLHL